MPNMTLAAVAVQRRSIAIALFRRTHLEEVLVRQLPTEAIKAGNSLVGFLRQVLERHPIEVAAFEVADDEGTRIHQYLQQVEVGFVAAAVPVPARVVPEFCCVTATPQGPSPQNRALDLANSEQPRVRPRCTGRRRTGSSRSNRTAFHH